MTMGSQKRREDLRILGIVRLARKRNSSLRLRQLVRACGRKDAQTKISEANANPGHIAAVLAKRTCVA